MIINIEYFLTLWYILISRVMKIVIKLGGLSMSLYRLKNKTACVIESMPVLALLNSMGVREGIKLIVKSKQPLGGPMVVQVGNRNIAIAKDIAESIVVREG